MDSMNWYQIMILIGVPSIISTLVSGLLIWTLNKFRTNKKKATIDEILVKESLQALLRNELVQSSEKFIKAGFVDIPNKQNFENMYSKYHLLGQNGVMDTIRCNVMQLPTEKPVKKRINRKVDIE